MGPAADKFYSMRKRVNSIFQRGFIWLCLASSAIAPRCLAQQPAPQPAQPTPAQTQSVQSPSSAVTTGASKSEHYPDDGDFSLQVFYWYSLQNFNLRGGAANTVTGSSPDLNFQSVYDRTPGAEVSVPLGHNFLRLSYFQIAGEGHTIAPANLTLFSQAYNPGDYLNTTNKIQNAKLSFDFMSFPFPAKSTGIRIRTLWEMQYTDVKGFIDAPLKPYPLNSAGAPITTTYAVNGGYSIIYPSFGIGIEDALSKNLLIEANASAFWFPHRSDIWDAAADLKYSLGPIELAVGMKGFHLKTSPRNVQYYVGTFDGAYVSLAWHFRL
jgi:hypothetical protein